jgi:cytochrome c biogenesis protein CcmG/thiol:disulfide interchange protein DsbE
VQSVSLMGLIRRSGILLLLVLGTPDLALGKDLVTAPQTAPPWKTLQEFDGKVVLVDFWASWCAPCRRSFPWMNEMQRRYSKQGLAVVAVNVDQEKKLADDFLAALPAEFRIEFDAKGVVAQQFMVRNMPTSFLIDRRGRVRIRHTGFRDGQREEREQQIVQLLKEPK